MKDPIVDILLSTFNGAKYVKEQIESIYGQTEKNWRLIIRDDGSNDETLRIVRAAQDCDPRVFLVSSSGRNLGVVHSFIELLKESTAPFFAFCDQDDFWLPTKLKSLIDRIAIENSQSAVFLHSDLIVVDEHLNEIYPSFMAQQGFQSDIPVQWPSGLLQNTVVGCTCVGNAALRRLVLLNQPDDWSDVFVHDWWLGLIASRFGQLLFEPRPTVLYRQHAKNQLGAKDTSIVRYAQSIFAERPLRKVKNYLESVARQAAAFRSAFEEELSSDDFDILDDLVSIGRSHGLRRTAFLCKCYGRNVRMQTSGRNILLFIASPFG